MKRLRLLTALWALALAFLLVPLSLAAEVQSPQQDMTYTSPVSIDIVANETEDIIAYILEPNGLLDGCFECDSFEEELWLSEGDYILRVLSASTEDEMTDEHEIAFTVDDEGAIGDDNQTDDNGTDTNQTDGNETGGDDDTNNETDNGNETGTEGIGLEIDSTVIAASEGMVELTATTQTEADLLYSIDDGQYNLLCLDCMDASENLSLDDGTHVITVRALTADDVEEESLEVTVDVTGVTDDNATDANNTADDNATDVGDETDENESIGNQTDTGNQTDDGLNITDTNTTDDNQTDGTNGTDGDGTVDDGSDDIDTNVTDDNDSDTNTTDTNQTDDEVDETDDGTGTDDETDGGVGTVDDTDDNQTETNGSETNESDTNQSAGILLSPQEGETYGHFVPIEVELDTWADISYMIDGGTALEACANCTDFNGTVYVAQEGEHTFTLQVMYYNGTVNQTNMTVNGTNDTNLTTNQTDMNMTDGTLNMTTEVVEVTFMVETPANDSTGNETDGNETNESMYGDNFEDLADMYLAGELSDEELAAIIRANELSRDVLDELVTTHALGPLAIDAIIETQSAPPTVLQQVLRFFGTDILTPKERLLMEYDLTDAQEQALLADQDEVSDDVREEFAATNT